MSDGTKYSTGTDSDGRRWESDTRHVLRQWTSKPFQGHRHRHERVEQRIVVEYFHGIGADIIHEARSEDSPKFDDGWATVQRIEIREYGARYDRRPAARWLE